jgi:hypothetical protein
MGQDHIARNSVVFESYASDHAHVFLIPSMPQQEASAAHLDKSKMCAEVVWHLSHHQRLRLSMSVFVTRQSRSVGSSVSCGSFGEKPANAHGPSTLDFSEASISEVDEVPLSLRLPPYLNISPTIQWTSFALFRLVCVLGIIA